MRHVTIIGVGLLGGSIGLAVKARWPGVHVAGVGRRPQSLQQALQVHAVDSIHTDPRGPAAETDLLILATPVGAFADHLRLVAPVLAPRAIVTDVGSTKAEVVATAEEILDAATPGAAARFVGSHPMAGSERKGPTFACAELLKGAVCIVTPTERTSPAAAGAVSEFWRTLGMKVVSMNPQDHDAAVAEVSHLPHALSCLLMLLPKDASLPLAATGFRDMTRLCGGDPQMWADILSTNRANMAECLAHYRDSVDELIGLLQTADNEKLMTFLQQAQDRRASAKISPAP